MGADWIEWKGGECPVPDGTMVDVRLRSGIACNCCSGVGMRWSHAGNNSDIVAYRLAYQQTATTADLLGLPRAPAYASLADVLQRAYLQASAGKGAERHAQGQPFDQQPMQQLIALYGPGFALGQAAKKAQESQRLPRDRAVAELLGAINYLAGAVIALEKGAE